MAKSVDKLIQGATRAADVAAKATAGLVAKGRVQVDKAALQNRLGKIQRQLGELVYTLQKTGEENHSLVARYVQEIDGIKEQLALLNSPEKSGVSVHACPGCGAEVQEDAMFCSCCGHKLS